MHDEPPLTDPRIPLAAERTLLAWIRTGLALMGLGFIIAKSSAFIAPPAPGAEASITPTLVLGVLLVLLGVMATMGAALAHRRSMARLAPLVGGTGRAPRLALVVAGVMAAVGVGLALVLLLE